MVARGRAASATLDDADASYDQGELHELPRSDRAWRGELGASQFLTGHVFKRLELVPVARVPAAVALEALAGGVGCLTCGPAVLGMLLLTLTEPNSSWDDLASAVSRTLLASIQHGVIKAIASNRHQQF